jgi:hypothetical protein
MPHNFQYEKDIIKTLKSCWNFEQENRPDFTSILEELNKIKNQIQNIELNDIEINKDDFKIKEAGN